MTVATDGLSSAEVARRVGISYRQLVYWCRLGLVRPSVHEATGSGDHHLWSEADVHVLRAVGALTAQGLGVDVCKRALSFVRDSDGCRWLVISHGGKEVAVVADGHLEETLPTIGGTATVVDLSEADGGGG